MAEEQKNSKRGSKPTRRVRRRLNPDERRLEILEAALRVLARIGPHNARVEDITREADAAKGTFFLYFPTWNDLITAVRDHLISTYAAELRERIAQKSPLSWQVIEDECVRFIDTILELGELHAAVFHSLPSDRENERVHAADGIIADMISDGVRTGACRPINPEHAAPLLFAALHATADGISLCGERTERIDSALDLIRSWLKA